MKKSKFTEEQIVGILRETDRDPGAASRRPVSQLGSRVDGALARTF